MRVRIDPDGDLLFVGLPLVLADTLQRLPDLLTSSDPRVRDRLLPRTYHDDESEAHWRRYVTPDLEHLFASRVDIVRKDLRGLELDLTGAGDSFRLRIPGRHRAAWQSALNGASHSVFLQAGLQPSDMERSPGTLGDPERDLALLRVQLLGYLLGRILEAEGFEFPTRDEIDDWEPGPGE